MTKNITAAKITKDPEISVVMPAYNARQTIANAIMSIKNQSFENWELIIVDDFSNDDTLEVVNKFATNDPRIISLKFAAHQGLVKARNAGNSVAKSDIIAIQDADDLSLPDRLERGVQLINSGWDVISHGAYINMWDAEYNCITRRYLKTEQISKNKILQNQFLPGWPIFKKSVWEQKPFRLETEYAYDYMMWLDWILSDFKIYSFNYGLYEYIRHENSASQIFEKDGRRQQSINKIKEIVKNEYGETLI